MKFYGYSNQKINAFYYQQVSELIIDWFYKNITTKPNQTHCKSKHWLYLAILGILYTWSIWDNQLFGRGSLIIIFLFDSRETMDEQGSVTHITYVHAFLDGPKMLESICSKSLHVFTKGSAVLLLAIDGMCRVCSATKDQPPTNDQRPCFPKRS